MTFRHFEIFITVCEEGGMTRAAKRLGISQPSVSQAVREMEEHYGTPLFERLGKRVVLTDAGMTGLIHAKQIMKSRDELSASVKDKARSRIVRIGATVTIGTYLLPEIRWPAGISLYPVVENTARIEQLLLEGALDIGLVEGETKSPYLTRQPFYQDRLVIICSAENDLAARSLRVRDLAGRAFYVREEGSGSRNLFAVGMRQRGVPYRMAGEINNMEALKNFARADPANLAVISTLAIDKSIAVLDIADLDLSRSFDVVHHKDKVITPALRQFMDALLGSITAFPRQDPTARSASRRRR